MAVGGSQPVIDPGEDIPVDIPDIPDDPTGGSTDPVADVPSVNLGSRESTIDSARNDYQQERNELQEKRREQRKELKQQRRNTANQKISRAKSLRDEANKLLGKPLLKNPPNNDFETVRNTLQSVVSKLDSAISTLNQYKNNL